MKYSSRFLLVILLGLTTNVHSQAITNFGNMQVHTGGSVASTLSFSNMSTAALTNNGSIRLKSNIANDQDAMPAGTGTWYLEGNSAQTVSGAASLRVYNLVTNNSGGIILNTDLSVSGAHTFTAGMITPSAAPKYLVYESGATHSGSTDARHVNGWVKKIGSGDFIFPVGDDTYLRSVAITNLSAAAEFNCHYYVTTQNIYSLWSPLVQVRAREYWQLNKISGGTAKVTLNWDNSKLPMDNVLVPDILASHYSGTLWMSDGGTASGTIATTGTVTSNSMSNFGPVTFGYKAFPVPLKLVSFYGNRRNGISELHWISENEYMVDHFEVQRSFNATDFVSVISEPGRNHTDRELYNADDAVAFQGVVYYRLKMIDQDGQYTYSKVIALVDGVAKEGLYANNPASRVITVMNRTGVSGACSYHLISQAGQEVASGKLVLAAGNPSVIDLPFQIAAGIYSLRINNTATILDQKIMITR
jgi:hypothetical protein